ncbi:MAG TPA: VOC family protein [Bryobacteraceae bacterium]|jgi:catechol 2,3-dioxygenase-like lactoylglutathione lyase family enzyme|nr:VOC family protein [Bryobacteraceae bacterium]
MRPSVNGLLESALFVENLSEVRDFYRDVIGLEMVVESESGCVFVVAKGQLLLLVSHKKARVPSKTPGGEVPACVDGAGQILGAGHIAFAIAETEVEAWRDRLESHGVTVLAIVAWQQGATSLYFRDPDGHLLELATPGLWGLSPHKLPPAN